jgi:hypothetical protein
MKNLKFTILLLLILLFPLISNGQKHGVSMNSDIGLSGFYASNDAGFDYNLNLFQRYSTGYTYETADWSFGANLYYMDFRFEANLEVPAYSNGPMVTNRSIYSSRHLGVAPFVSRIIFKTENYSFSIKFMPGIDKKILSKQYLEQWPSDNTDNVTVIHDWSEDEYANYDQINFNLTLVIEASRSITENINLSGGLFLFSYLHNATRGNDIDEIFLPYAFGVNLRFDYLFGTAEK